MSKSKVYRENGYYFNAKTGEQYLWQDDALVAYRAIRRGEKKPTFGYKLRRFLRRFGRACSRAIESATIYMQYNYHGEEPPLTAEEMHRLHVKPDDKVIVWGASRG